jgi:hypothetical protein
MTEPSVRAILYMNKYTQPVLISVMLSESTNVPLQSFVILCKHIALELKFYSINLDGIINCMNNAGINIFCKLNLFHKKIRTHFTITPPILHVMSKWYYYRYLACIVKR